MKNLSIGIINTNNMNTIIHPYRERQHIIVDLETLDTRPTAYAWEIAAVHINKGEVTSLLFNSSIGHKTGSIWRTESIDTREWTAKQGNLPAAIRATNEGRPVSQVMAEFILWLTQFDNPMLWSWGKDFDFPILNMHADHLGMKLPYSYSNVHCIRDLWKMQNPNAKESPTRNAKHRALEDAQAEAVILQECLAKLPDVEAPAVVFEGWNTTTLPTKGDCDDSLMLAVYDECQSKKFVRYRLGFAQRHITPWVRTEEVQHFTAENPAPHPFDHPRAKK